MLHHTEGSNHLGLVLASALSRSVCLGVLIQVLESERIPQQRQLQQALDSAEAARAAAEAKLRSALAEAAEAAGQHSLRHHCVFLCAADERQQIHLCGCICRLELPVLACDPQLEHGLCTPADMLMVAAA